LYSVRETQCTLKEQTLYDDDDDDDDDDNNNNNSNSNNNHGRLHKRSEQLQNGYKRYRTPEERPRK